MPNDYPRPTTRQPAPTANGYYDFLTSIFPKATPHAKIAFVIKSFLLTTPEPFSGQSVVDCITMHGSMLPARPENVLQRLKLEKPSVTEGQVPEVVYLSTNLSRDEVSVAMADVENMDHTIGSDPSIVTRAMMRQVFAPLSGPWNALTAGLRDLMKSPELRGENKFAVSSGTTVTFDQAGIPSVKINAAPKDEPKGHEYSEASVKQEADLASCGTAIRNMLLMQEGHTRIGLSAVHDAMGALGYSKQTILEAIDAAQRTGALYMEGNALVPSTMLPSTLGGWGATIIDLNREKGWYDEEQLSEKAARALAKLSADEQAELLKHMPLIPHRDPKGRIDVATFCTNLTGEISELWEAYRTGDLDKPCDKSAKMKALGLPELTCAEEEIADILIRTLDTAEFWNMDIARAVKAKHLYNQSRSFRHGNKTA